MESLLINIIIGCWLIAFGAMAIFPFLIESKATRRASHRSLEDVVISIQPVGMVDRAQHPAEEPVLAADTAHRQAA